MRRQITVRLDEEVIEALRRVARKLAYIQQKDLDWLDVLEEAGRQIAIETGELVPQDSYNGTVPVGLPCSWATGTSRPIEKGADE